MPLTIARFDLYESVPIPNVAKLSPAVRAILPNTFPFVFNEGTQEVVEPILIYLADKFTVPEAFVDGRWIKDNSASAAAADLKDWWAKIQAGDVPWDCADDSLVADWLVDMRTTVSGKTNDFLSDKTVRPSSGEPRASLSSIAGPSTESWSNASPIPIPRGVSPTSA